MRHYRCSLPIDTASAGVIRHLQQQGLLCADHTLRRGDRDIAVLTESEIDRLKQAGIDVQVLVEVSDTEADDAADAIVTGFVTAYLDSPGIDAAFATLHAQFPTLTTLTDLPETTTGYDGSAAALAGPSAVRLFRISTTPAVTSKPALFIVAGLHAREWAPPLAAIEFAAQLLNNYDPTSSDPDVIAVNALVDNLDILIVGAGNPDGIDFSHHDSAMWRKNRRPNATAPLCPGVNNNRNFSVYWGQVGSSPDPCDVQIYHGPAAFSEVENRNIRTIVEQFPNVLAAIDCHSFGEKFLRPQPGGGTFIASEPVDTADDAIYSAIEAAMNTAVGNVTPGKSYTAGSTSNHAGTFDEYMYFGHRIFAFELEIGEDFQPPIADALVSVQEAAAAMRALADETLALSARFINPAAIVQVIDKSGSMIASGYVDSTRGNAERLVDLMSLNDSVAVASFNGSATTELALTPILGAGDYATARSACAAIPFGGSTSIGGGLQQGLSLLPPPGVPRSLLLLSDGYENTPPMTVTVLPTVPSGVAVHTIALGLASDQGLLQDIATATGGTYFFSPDELELFEIYNAARGVMADADLAASDTIDFASPEPRREVRSVTRQIVVDCDADWADFSVAAQHPAVRLDAALQCLTLPEADLARIERRMGPGYVVLRIKRPQPGIYRLDIVAASAAPVKCSMAAWVRSPLRLILSKPRRNVAPGKPINLGFSVLDGRDPVEKDSVAAQAHCPLTSLELLAKQWTKDMHLPRKEIADPQSDDLMRALAVRDHLRQTTGRDPFAYIRQDVHLVHPKLGDFPASSMAVRLPTANSIEGTYNLRISVQGRTRAGCPFTRVAFRSVPVWRARG